MKKGVLILGLVFSVIMVATLVAAQSLPAPPIALSDISTFLSKIFTAELAQGGESLIARILIFLILATLLYKPATKIVGGNDNLGLFLSALVSVVAVRFLTPTELMGLFLPYSAVGIAISIAAPLMLVLYFMETSSIGVAYRRFVWMAFGVSFIVLWWQRWGDIGDLAWIYLLAAAISLVVLVFEGTIRNMFYSSKIESKKGRVAYMQIMDLQDKLNVAYQRLAKASSDQERSVLKEEIDEYNTNIAVLQKQIK